MVWQEIIHSIPIVLAAATAAVFPFNLWRRCRRWLSAPATSARAAAFESIPDGAILLDAKNRIVDINPAALRLIGAPAATIIGRSIARVLPDHPDLIAPCYADKEAELDITIRGDDTPCHLAVRVSLLHENGARPTGRLIVFRDITQRVQTEAALRKAEAEARRQLIEQTFLQEAIALISSELDLESVLRHIAEQMCRIVNATSAYVLIWQAEQRASTVVAEYISPHACAEERLSDLGISYVTEDQQFLDALDVGQPWTDHVDDPDLSESDREHLLQYGGQAVLYIPLHARGQVIGFAELWESRRRRQFAPRDIALCQAIAQNAAIAIENAGLYRQVHEELKERTRVEETLRRLNEELETRVAERTAELTQMNSELKQGIEDRSQTEAELIQRNRELLSLQSAAAATVSSLDLPFVLETVTWEMVNLLGVQGCTISEWNQESNTISVIAEYGVTSWWDAESPDKTYELADFPLKKRVLTERCIQQTHIGQMAARTAEPAGTEGHPVKSRLMIPMIFQARVIGLVEIEDSEFERVFTDHEISLAQLLANQAAAAIENARLYAETQKRLHEQTALREAGAAISSALDPGTVLSQIAEQMGRAIDATSAYICGYDDNSAQSTVLAEYIGPNACPEEKVSDVGATYRYADEVEFIERMKSGRHDISDVKDPDLSRDDRVHMQRYGAKTILYVPLLSRGRLIGFAELWESRYHRDFRSEEISLCHGIAQQAAIGLENAQLYQRAQMEIAERKRVEEQIKASLKEKEVLLQEIHHRVKNNLQVVSSLLNLQSRGVENQAAQQMFQESQNRILSMALIHEKLYRSQDLSGIDLAEYIRSLATDLMHSYRAQSGPVSLNVDATDVFLSIDKAVPCGLIVNELISNALKHAFPEHTHASVHEQNGRGNKIYIKLSADRQRQVRLVVGDNGIGFPEDLDVQSLDSLGLRLINTLVSQLEGTLELNNHDGAQFKLEFAMS